MNGRYLLDTNVVIGLFANEAEITRLLEIADETFIPSVVLGELYYGAHKSSRASENLARLDAFAAQSAVLACTVDTARHYGEVKHRLRLKGRPIPENDVWVAAIAVQHGLTLLTRDTHFSEVDGLSTEPS